MNMFTLSFKGNQFQFGPTEAPWLLVIAFVGGTISLI